MNLSRIRCTVLFLLLLATFATAAEKTAPTYQKGTITGYESRLDTWSMSSDSNKRREKVYELEGVGFIYKIGYCGSFQAGKFAAGQAVEYRVDGDRLFIRHDDDKEYKCKIEGTKKQEAKPAEGAKP